jgi:hypothetical protein
MQRRAFNWVWEYRDGCGHAEEGFDSLELGVGMHRWVSTSLNWVGG